MTDEQIKRLRELSEKATPGPWEHNKAIGEIDGVDCSEIQIGPSGLLVAAIPADQNGDFDPQDEANAAFMAAARNALPELLDALDEAGRQIRNLKALEVHFYRQFRDLCGLTVTGPSDVDVALRALRTDSDTHDALKAENAALKARVEKLEEAGKQLRAAMTRPIADVVLIEKFKAAEEKWAAALGRAGEP